MPMSPLPHSRSVSGLAAGFLLSAFVAGAAGPTAAVDFSRDIRPILSGKCYHCHGPDGESRKAGLRLDLRDEAVKPRKSGPAVIPGKPESSPLMARVLSKDPDEVMPPPKTGHVLSAGEVDSLRRWIAEGAPYSGHWAFQPPGKAPLPPGRGSHPVDRFVEAGLKPLGLRLSPEADRASLLRRLSFDLIGLPPTPEEIAAFEADRSPGAYERVVDRLLASPHFGERWARPWLDLARYADSAGLGSDPLRLNIWPYREWLVDALNRNLPYDEFTRQQLAGDLIPGADDSTRAATAFHRNTMTNTEGGTDDEEWRVAAVKDRANVTLQAWMGLTFGCAQCHTHKFDPISQKDYYSVFAVFNQTADNDQPDERPTMPYLSASERAEKSRRETRLREIGARFDAADPAYDQELRAWAEEAAKPNAWMSRVPSVVVSTSTNGSTFRILEDRSVLAEGDGPDRDAYRVSVRLPAGVHTAVRLEALADASHPGGGPGRAKGEGNLVLTDVRAQLTVAGGTPAKVRHVRVEAPGKGRILSLAEVQVFSGGRNVAGGGSVRQSSTGYLGDAGRAIDGNTDGDYDGARSTTHTETEDNPWWELDLGREFPVEEVALWNRTDGPGARLAGSRVILLDAERKETWSAKVEAAPAPVVFLGPAPGRALGLRNPTADHSQEGFDAAKAVDGNPGRKSGWAVGGALGRDHAWVAEFETPLKLDAESTLVVTLTHAFGDRQTLGRFRISTTDRPSPVRELPSAVSAVLKAPFAAWTPEQRRRVEEHHRPLSKAKGGLWKEMAEARAAVEAVAGVPLPVMEELPEARRRVTRVLNKGNFLDPGETVEPTVPSAFGNFPAGAPRNRLGLAAWLTDRANPLTARVAVNRFWSALFGTGIVETEEDFGTQGSLPSHPELLDWLAVEFMEPGRPSVRAWDTKAMLRFLVTSRAYRQSAKVPAESLAKDPRNRLLSHFPRRRLDAEMVRDQALAVSGLLSRKVGGPSVYPYQPDGLWRAAFNGERSYRMSEGEDRFRRGLYTVWRRTVPHPSMATFDAPSRETCTFRRQPTNTPLQAYVTLNDPTFVEAAQALARRLVEEGGATPESRVRHGWRLVTGRPPSERDVADLVALFRSMSEDFARRPSDAEAFATRPLGPLRPGLETAEAAAWTAVANVLLNLDPVLTKG